MKEIIYVTTNKAKINMLQNIVGGQYRILGLQDVGITAQADEDGLSPRENSLKKARTCFKITHKPCFAMDYGFRIVGLAEEEQPKQDVRGIVEKSIGHKANDEEVIIHKTFVDMPSVKREEGFPLSSLCKNEKLNTYEVEMTNTERRMLSAPTDEKIRTFIKKMMMHS